MKGNGLTTKEITYIALGIAALISGGLAIYQVSAVFPLLGGKYILMAPYLSMVLYVILTKVSLRYGVLVVGSVFALIMAPVNLFMMISILLTSVLTELATLPLRHKGVKRMASATLFSSFTGVSSLVVSKYLIGGVFMAITFEWLIYSGILCTIFGGIGTLLAVRLLKHIGEFRL